ncbi:acetamidase/Formamidase [Haloarcula amylolytica JCM 13557]|uniref:Acetamidase/Formamidase n=1 Tax=Haloarcula amylolytica JCM 13557 TaxID=1227452 RepID=M0KP71_9EURY|nr:acetamidase/Formamidase [Haloarcula amylolytica JCM 13557]
MYAAVDPQTNKLLHTKHRPTTTKVLAHAFLTELSEKHDVDVQENMAPIQVVGSGATVNDATQNAFDRATTLLDTSEGEVRARCTFTAGVQIGRLPGVVQLDMLSPLDILEDRGLGDAVQTQ